MTETTAAETGMTMAKPTNPPTWSELDARGKAGAAIGIAVLVMTFIALLTLLWIIFDDPVRWLLKWLEQFESPSY